MPSIITVALTINGGHDQHVEQENRNQKNKVQKAVTKTVIIYK